MERYLQDVLGSNKFAGVEITRSKTMSAIRAKGNRTTEVKLRMALIRAGISGWCLHPADIIGKPDFHFRSESLAIFVDGCFWHGCCRCGHTPKTRSAFWSAKFSRNQARDRAVARSLRKQGIRVVRFWEHQLKSSGGQSKAIAKITYLLRD
jgi:DNA mismatch endonuclease (patch repair protein)